MAEISLSDQIAELKRELGMRRKVYPNLVTGGRLKQPEMDRRISIMEATLRLLEGLAEKDRLI
jgi:hypothetical protein